MFFSFNLFQVSRDADVENILHCVARRNIERTTKRKEEEEYANIHVYS